MILIGSRKLSVQRRQPHIINNRYLLPWYSCPNQAPGLRPLLRGELWTIAFIVDLVRLAFRASLG